MDSDLVQSELALVQGFRASAFVWNELRRIERKLHRISESECNDVVSERGVKARDTRRKKLMARAIALVESTPSLPCRVYFQGDPRGCALYLVPNSVPEQETNSLYASLGVAVV